jgi:hypothetical protein
VAERKTEKKGWEGSRAGREEERDERKAGREKGGERREGCWEG